MRPTRRRRRRRHRRHRCLARTKCLCSNTRGWSTSCKGKKTPTATPTKVRCLHRRQRFHICALPWARARVRPRFPRQRRRRPPHVLQSPSYQMFCCTDVTGTIFLHTKQSPRA